MVYIVAEIVTKHIKQQLIFHQRGKNRLNVPAPATVFSMTNNQ
ncbi:hypothetical protein EPIR_3524 [Erwinia piriflorinigrans CFBP 5888]|uniref:Uncharacterized protein n=1 Tax=Erwinia piriflorinigrans CFBP 5888 TaxID=1161919 RepID=V5ZCW9_9GAMM|nr:hypothetical protein EPIR_3524 [Erwinia piriflorinigrans CFBP 5888]